VKQFLNRHGTRITAWVFILVLSLLSAGIVTGNLGFYVAFSLASMFGVPILLLLAWTAWVRNVRPGMPSWRNGLCLTAFVITFLHWAYMTGVLGTAYASWALGSHSNWIDSDSIYYLFLMKSADLVAIVLAIALKRAPRIQLIGVGVLMLLIVPIGYA
jgi:hypothetical protein